ncbi:MAG: HipA domain-containing protein [Bacilli bacterium]|nr:HipA domain-containing protein [Bacilli bacterium]
MEKYSIKTPNKDFKFSVINPNTKGTRVKKLIIDNFGEKAFFKYEGNDYLVSEACSEKMCYEIAKVLEYPCAKIELAMDNNGVLGILNYLFIKIGNVEHMDAVSYLNIHNNQRSMFYTISNIKKTLDNLDVKLFEDFIRIMIFDALVGEQDRHEENWGITKIGNKYKLSPLYDNGDSLLRNFKDIYYAEKYYSGKKSFDSYINKSKTIIYKEDNKKQYKHFELIKYLNENYSDIVQKEISNLNKLTDEAIENIVNKIPDELLTKIHKEYIIIYLKKRRDILLNIK